MTKTAIDKLLDTLGLAGAGVVGFAALYEGAIPRWLVITGGIVAYVTGKAAAPGVPFLSKPAAEQPKGTT